MTAVKITGMKSVQAALNEFAFDMDKAISKAIGKTALTVQRGAVALIRQPSIGNAVTRYTAGGKPYDHTSSKEGDAPNTDTGRLINSIAVNHERGAHIAHVFTNLEYGLRLETDLNRPFLEPAKVAEKKTFGKNLEAAIEAQVDKAGK